MTALALSHSILLNCDRMFLIHVRILEPPQGPVLLLLVRAGNRSPPVPHLQPARRAVPGDTAPGGADLAHWFRVIGDVTRKMPLLAYLIVFQLRHVGMTGFEPA